MIRSFNLTIIFLLIFFCLTSGQDAKPLIEVKSEVDTALITIGDRITYTITIDHIAGMRVEQPGAGVNLGQFEIKDYKIYDPEKKGDHGILKYEYVISVFDTGSFTIPAFPIAYFPEDSVSNYKIIEASPIPIYVESVIQDEAREMRDIKPPLAIPFSYTFIISIIAGGLLLAILIYLAIIFYKKRKKKGYLLKPPAPPRPAHEIALDALEKLLLKNLIEQGEIKHFYSEVSEIMRRYIENRFFINALEETSREILQDMQNEDVAVEQYEILQNFLHQSDFVKFAKYLPSSDENEAIINWARDFILSTQFKYEEEVIGTIVPKAS